MTMERLRAKLTSPLPPASAAFTAASCDSAAASLADSFCRSPINAHRSSELSDLQADGVGMSGVRGQQCSVCPHHCDSLADALRDGLTGELEPLLASLRRACVQNTHV